MKIKTIYGLTYAHAKKIAKLEFGDELIKVNINKRFNTYDVYVRKPLDAYIIKRFNRNWNNTFGIIPINGCKTNTDIEKAWISKIKSIERRKQVLKNKKENPVITKWEDPFLYKIK